MPKFVALPRGCASRAFLLSGFLLGALPLAATAEPPAAEAFVPLAPGDVVVSGFSGSKLAAEGIPPGVDPIDKTIISVDDASLRILNLTTLGGSATGQVFAPALKFDVKARDIGQVFGLAVDAPDDGAVPNLFAAATSAFGLQIVATQADKDGTPVRLKAGGPDARFMTGQFGGLSGAGPGTIFKIDGTTGAPSVFANTDQNGVANSGAGLSGLAIDPASRSLFVADLDTGLIHRFALDPEQQPSSVQFDHGTTGRAAIGQPAIADDAKRLDATSAAFNPEDVATWGMAPSERRVTGLAVRDGRMFYAVAAGPEIWSVALNADGSFGTDPRLETAVKVANPAASVVSITFDAGGNMLVATRGAVKSARNYGQFVEPGSGQVLKFAKGADGSTALWSPEPQEFAIGAGAGNTGASGGLSVAHGYDADGAIDLTKCDATLAAGGDALAAPDSDEQSIHGLQINAVELVKPDNTPPTKSVFIDFDSRPGNKDERGHVGAVLAIQKCGAADAPPGSIAEGPGGEGAPSPGEPGPGGGEPQAVDPNAPNMAVEKTQNCQLTGTDALDCTYSITATNTGASPFALSGASFEDVFSTKPESISVEGGGEVQTGTGFKFSMPEGTEIPAGGQSQTISVRATFKVPPGGMTVENCASLLPASDAAGGGGASDTEDKPLTVSASPAKCGTPVNGQRICTFDISLDNKSKRANFDFIAQLSVAPLKFEPQSMAMDLGVLIGDPGAKSFRVTANTSKPVPRVLVGIFPASEPEPVMTTEITLAEQAQAKAVGLVDPAAAGTAEGQEAVAAEETGLEPGDANPTDDTSCIKFDTNNPNDQGTPTNEPTEPQPEQMADAGGEGQGAGPNPGGGEGGGAATGPLPGAGNLRLEKIFRNCLLNPGTNRTEATCIFDVNVVNEGNQAVPLAGVTQLTDTFSIKPKQLILPPRAVATPNGFVLNADNDPTIPPGQMTIPVRAIFDVPPSGLLGENCAELTFAPPGSEIPPPFTNTAAESIADAPPPSPQVIPSVVDQGFKIEPDGACIARGAVKDCSWTVTMENSGELPFTMDFDFTTQVGNLRLVSATGFTMLRNSETSTGFRSNIPVPPKTSKSVRVTGTFANDGGAVNGTVSVVGSSGLDTNTTNNVATAVAGTEPPTEMAGAEVFNGDTVAEDNKKCVPFTANPLTTNMAVNLDIKKTSRGSCEKIEDRQVWECPFLVEVTNKSNEKFEGDIEIKDNTNFKSFTTLGGGTETIGCSSAQLILDSRSCFMRKQRLGPGETQTQGLMSTIPISEVPISTKPGECVLKNTIAILSPNGIGNETSEATSVLETGPNRGAAIPCDPPALELKKSAQGCTPGGAGFDCKFKLTVTSVGQDPFEQGVINILEQLPANATVKSQTAGWKCSGTGFVHCTFPDTSTNKAANVTLLVNQKLDLDLEISVPKDSVKPGQCEIPNTAKLVEIDRPNEKLAAQYVATASAKINSPECAPKCDGGMTLNDAGLCACPSGQIYNTGRKSCNKPLTEACPTGWEGDHPNCCRLPERYDAASRTCREPPGKCYGGMVLVSATGRCGCPGGQSYDSRRGTCGRAPPQQCIAGYSGVYPTCCPPSQYYKDGQCYLREVRTPAVLTDTTYTPPPPREYCPNGMPKVRGRDCPTRNTGGPSTTYQEPPIYCRDGSVVRAGQRCPSITGGTDKTVDNTGGRCPVGYYKLSRGTRYRCYPIVSGNDTSTKGGTSTSGGGDPKCAPGYYPVKRGRMHRCLKNVVDVPKTNTNEPGVCRPGTYRVRYGRFSRCIPHRNPGPKGGANTTQNNPTIRDPDCPRTHYKVRRGGVTRCYPRGGGQVQNNSRRQTFGGQSGSRFTPERRRELHRRFMRARGGGCKSYEIRGGDGKCYYNSQGVR